MNNLQEVLNGWFKFKEWSKYQSAPKEFENTLDHFGSFEIYNSFHEFLDINDIYLEDSEGEIIDTDEIFTNERSFQDFLESQTNISSVYAINLDDINKPILFGQVKDGTEPQVYLELINNINNEDDLLSFINEVLYDGGGVTHSSGVKSRYEVVGIDIN